MKLSGSVIAQILALVVVNFLGPSALAEPPAPHAGGVAMTLSEQGAERVLIVVVYDRSCKKWCEQARPLIRELAGPYGSQVKVLELDAAPEVLSEAKEKARQNGVYNFLRASTDFVPLVGFFCQCGSGRKLVKQLAGPKSRDVYESALKKALERT